jgi:RecA-family ATPase
MFKDDISISKERIIEHSDQLIENLIAEPGVFTATELLNRNMTDIPHLLKPIFPKVGLIGLAGSSDTGKSSLLRQFAVSVSLGEPSFLGFELRAEFKKSIYVSTEDDEFAISYLLNKANTKKQLNPDLFNGLRFVFDVSNLIEKLEKILSQQKTDLVIIDAFSDLYGKSMNDTNQVRTFLNEYSQLAQKYRCLIIFLHHTGKRTEDQPPSKHNLLGSQGFEAKMRLVIELRNDLMESDLRHLCIVKGNYLPAKFKTESFVLRFDENLQFHSTDERKPFDELTTESKVDLKKTVKKLKLDGLTQTVISKKLNISQTTVSRYLAE